MLPRLFTFVTLVLKNRRSGSGKLIHPSSMECVCNVLIIVTVCWDMQSATLVGSKVILLTFVCFMTF